MSADVVGWTVAAFLFGVLLTLVALGVAHFVHGRRTGRAPLSAKLHRSETRIHPDPELGECGSSPKGSAKQAVAPGTPRQLCETLRQLLETELPKGLAASGLADQLDRLEQKLARSASPTAAAATEIRLPVVGLRGAAVANSGAEDKASPPASALQDDDTRTPETSERSSGKSNGGAADEEAEASMSLQESQEAHIFELSNGSQSLQSVDRPEQLQFGPTARQRELPEPREKWVPPPAEEKSLGTSLKTVQKVLGRRDAQTSELHRQLREVRQSLWVQTLEARDSNAKLRALLTDPSRVPQAQAEAIENLTLNVKDLSGRLADARTQEKYWLNIAKRQRAFFVQNESIGDEGRQLLRRHPAGEVFLVIAPMSASAAEDIDEAEGAASWDVGSSHCNPYKVDSWPAEPNVLAHRNTMQASFEQCAEGDEEEGDEPSEEEEEPSEDEEDDDADEEPASPLSGRPASSMGDSER